MELRVLRYFLTVAREGNITRAAEALHVTQPTLSRQIAQMEEELGVTLIARGARKIALTEEGLLLRRRAEEILQLADGAANEMRAQSGALEGVVALDCGEFAAVETVLKMLVGFRAQYPRVRFDIYTGSADHIRERLEKGLSDVGLLLEPIDAEALGYIRVRVPERWGALLRPDDPLARKPFVTAADLVGSPLITVHRNAMQAELRSWFGDMADSLDAAFSSNLSTNAAIMVRQGLGRALVIEGSLPYLDQAQVAFRPLSPALTTTSILAWKQGQPFGRAAERFLAHAKCFLGMDSVTN